MTCIICIFRFHKSSDQTKKQRVVQILNKLITLTIKEEELSPSIQSKIWCSIGKVSIFELVYKTVLLFIKKITDFIICFVVNPVASKNMVYRSLHNELQQQNKNVHSFSAASAYYHVLYFSFYWLKRQVILHFVS